MAKLYEQAIDSLKADRWKKLWTDKSARKEVKEALDNSKHVAKAVKKYGARALMLIMAAKKPDAVAKAILKGGQNALYVLEQPAVWQDWNQGKYGRKAANAVGEHSEAIMKISLKMGGHNYAPLVKIAAEHGSKVFGKLGKLAEPKNSAQFYKAAGILLSKKRGRVKIGVKKGLPHFWIK